MQIYVNNTDSQKNGDQTDTYFLNPRSGNFVKKIVSNKTPDSYANDIKLCSKFK